MTKRLKTGFRRALALNLALASVATGLLMGCGSTVSDRSEHHTSGWWDNHLDGYFHVVRRNMTNLYRTTDRHIFDYDWDDPYMD